ncbi:MAG: hypothetical protein Q7O66_14710, partial [Dehalococcoidia bacterium]|nr:hypothetical protein [Dehalococcoidia bacterium]
FNLSVAKGVAAFAALTLPYLPLAVWQWEVITDQGYRIDAYYSNIDLSGIVSELFFKFTSRYSFLPDWLLVAVFGTVTLVGILPLLRRQSTSLDWLRTVILAAFIVVPIAISYVFVQRSGVFDDRYMILVLPVYFLALSFGLDRIARLSRTLSAIVILLFLVINAQPLIEKQLHGWATKEDWRGVVAYVEARSLPDDRFIFLAPGMNTGYAYYASQPFRTINLSVVPTRLSSDATFQEVRAKMDQSHRLWVILTHYSQADANSLLGALKDNMRVIDEHSFWGLAVYRFDDGPTTKSNESPPKTELSINFENKLRLVGMTAQRPLPEGDRLAIYSLYWEALTTPLPDYSVSLRLVDEDNIVWGKGDGVPGGISHSTKIWQPGQLFRDDHEIPITVGTPPGQYKLEVHVYERSTLRELSVLTRDGVPAGTKAPLSTVTLPVTTNGSKTANHSQATFRGELSLDQTRLEDTQIRPGEAFLLTTQWRTLSRIVDTPVATASLVDSRGAIAAQWPIPLAKPSYPLATWEVGHPVTGIHKLYLPATMADGRYTVRLSVQGSDGRQWPIGRWPYLGSSDQTQVGILDVHGREQVFEPPPMARQADLLFPKAGRLVGYELRVGENIIDSPSNRVVVPAGTKLEVRLLWRGVGTPEMELASFVHLLDSNGRLRAQHDGIPCEGGCPGRSWIDNEYLLDRHSVNLPPETKAGVYQLEIGLYNSLSGERLADSTGKKQETLELQIEVR